MELIKSLKEFKENKSIYYMVKNDILKGLLLEDDIHDVFVEKYVAFQLLDNLNKINKKNDKIEDEYQTFIKIQSIDNNI